MSDLSAFVSAPQALDSDALARARVALTKGGPGSGNHGHEGRPGLVGGSGSSGLTPHGDEDGTRAPRVGQPFVVYRLANQSGLDNVNAGNARSVADHMIRIDDPESPTTQFGFGATVAAYEVTITKDFGPYGFFVGGESRGGLGGVDQKEVGRNAKDPFGNPSNRVVYSFPRGGHFTVEAVGASVSVQEIRDELRKIVGRDVSFDSDQGINFVTQAMRDALSRKATPDVAPTKMMAMFLGDVAKGGAGSGNFGHSGEQEVLTVKEGDTLFVVDDDFTRLQDAQEWVAEINEPLDSYIAFRLTQIKSAISNTGAFDPSEPDFTKEFDVVTRKDGTVSAFRLKGGPGSGNDPDITKGGAGSGNHGHAGRPGERGGSAPGGGRVSLALKTHKPSTARKQRWADKTEANIRRLIGGESTGDNAPTDVNVVFGGTTHGIEVKVLLDNTNDKITMHPESRTRKIAWAKKHHAGLHTVVVDDRDRFGSPGYSGHKIYYREGVGSFRLEAMQQVSPRELRRLISSSKKSAKGGILDADEMPPRPEKAPPRSEESRARVRELVRAKSAKGDRS